MMMIDDEKYKVILQPLTIQHYFNQTAFIF